jgi:NAD(P)-dependent dehydrogenase (short-subunit alcohol dehydrogenase family)
MKQKILLTGGNGGLAKELIKEFSNLYDFVSIDIHKERDQGLADLDYDYFKCDICDAESLQKIKNCNLEKFQNISVIINNAAIDYVPTEEHEYRTEFSYSDALKVFEVNVLGAINVIETFKDLLVINSGSIVNISSVYSIVPPDQTIYEDLIGLNGLQFKKPIYYGLSKAALNYVTKFYVEELSSFGVRINTVIFGGIENNQPLSFRRKYIKKVPLRRMASREDVVGIFKWLLSDSLGYITGNEFKVDGGFLATK